MILIISIVWFNIDRDESDGDDGGDGGGDGDGETDKSDIFLDDLIRCIEKSAFVEKMALFLLYNDDFIFSFGPFQELVHPY